MSPSDTTTGDGYVNDSFRISDSKSAADFYKNARRIDPILLA